MKTITIEKTVFTIKELQEENSRAFDRAYQNWTEGNLDYDWWEFIYEHFDTMFSLFGLELNNKGKKNRTPEIYFSGFSSQGDGACFGGRYSYKKGWKKAIKAEFPRLEDSIMREFDTIASVMKKYFYTPTIDIECNAGRYSHSGNMSVSQYDYDNTEISDDDMETLKDSFRSLADEIYYSLEKEYEDQNSEEMFIEHCEDNEYEFDEYGDMV